MSKHEKKQVVIDEIKGNLEKASSIVLFDARGLTVEQDTSLRKQFRDEGVFYKVYKNTMLNLAVEGTDFEPCKEFLKGPTAVAFSFDDATLGARIANKNLKQMPVLEFKAGVIESVLYDSLGIAKIAKIPAKEELLSRLLGSFKSPIASFARLVKAISESKAEGNVKVEEEVVAEVTEAVVEEAVAAEVTEAVVEETVAAEVTEAVVEEAIVEETAVVEEAQEEPAAEPTEE